MSRNAIVFGLLLIGVTIATIVYNGGFESKTVFIPAVLGGLMALFGLLSMKGGLRMHAMHAAATIGLLGGLACLGMGIRQLTQLGSEKPPTIDKLASVWTTAILCILFVVMCVRSFIDARRKRIA